jgi:hypothetical protein
VALIAHVIIGSVVLVVCTGILVSFLLRRTGILVCF